LAAALAAATRAAASVGFLASVLVSGRLFREGISPLLAAAALEGGLGIAAALLAGLSADALAAILSLAAPAAPSVLRSDWVLLTDGAEDVTGGRETPVLVAGFAAVFDGDPGASPGLEAAPPPGAAPGAARVLEAAVGRGGRGIPP